MKAQKEFRGKYTQPILWSTAVLNEPLSHTRARTARKIRKRTMYRGSAANQPTLLFASDTGCSTLTGGRCRAE